MLIIIYELLLDIASFKLNRSLCATYYQWLVIVNRHIYQRRNLMSLHVSSLVDLSFCVLKR